jgi:hypothetical protein
MPELNLSYIPGVEPRSPNAKKKAVVTLYYKVLLDTFIQTRNNELMTP